MQAIGVACTGGCRDAALSLTSHLTSHPPTPHLDGVDLGQAILHLRHLKHLFSHRRVVQRGCQAEGGSRGRWAGGASERELPSAGEAPGVSQGRAGRERGGTPPWPIRQRAHLSGSSVARPALADGGIPGSSAPQGHPLTPQGCSAPVRPGRLEAPACRGGWVGGWLGVASCAAGTSRGAPSQQAGCLLAAPQCPAADPSSHLQPAPQPCWRPPT